MEVINVVGSDLLCGIRIGIDARNRPYKDTIVNSEAVTKANQFGFYIKVFFHDDSIVLELKSHAETDCTDTRLHEKSIP